VVAKDAAAYTAAATSLNSWRAPKRYTQMEGGLQLRVVKDRDTLPKRMSGSDGEGPIYINTIKRSFNLQGDDSWDDDCRHDDTDREDQSDDEGHNIVPMNQIEKTQCNGGHV
jgi:hypothetical protein